MNPKLDLRSPAVLMAIGVVATLVLALMVVMALLLTGGAKAVSDNAALIGALVALGGVFTAQMVGITLDNRRSQEARELEAERAHEAALQNYLEQVGKLLIEQPLHRASLGDTLSTIVRAQTLTVLEGLDPKRKRILLHFLRESGLILRDKPVVSLIFADLNNADLTSADLSEADLRGVMMAGAKLNLAALSKADLRFAYLLGANLSSANLFGANLSSANLFWADLSEADLTNAQLSEANLGLANLRNAQLRAANLSRANLSPSEIPHPYQLLLEITSEKFGLSGVNGSSAGESAADLSNANLSNANLSNANLNFVNLTNADLTRANLEEANLTNANLSGATLAGANLEEANLSSADLQDADLSDANLEGAEGITNEKLEQQAASLELSTMPNGQEYEEWSKERESRKEDAENE